MLLKHITSPECAISCTKTRVFRTGGAIAADRGINFIHPTAGLGGNGPTHQGAIMHCEWSGPIINGAPGFNAAGHKGRAMHGISGNVYSDALYPRCFLPTGTYDNLFIVRIEFLDYNELQKVAQSISTNRCKFGIFSALKRRREREIDDLCSEMIIKYSSLYVPLSVDD